MSKRKRKLVLSSRDPKTFADEATDYIMGLMLPELNEGLKEKGIEPISLAEIKQERSAKAK